MTGHWIRTNGHVRVAAMQGGGNLADGLMVVGIIVGFVVFLVVFIKVLDKCGRK